MTMTIYMALFFSFGIPAAISFIGIIILAIGATRKTPSFQFLGGWILFFMGIVTLLLNNVILS